MLHCCTVHEQRIGMHRNQHVKIQDSVPIECCNKPDIMTLPNAIINCAVDNPDADELHMCYSMQISY